MRFGTLVCQVKRAFGQDHSWRRARKGEAAHSRYCKLCGHGQAIKHRTPRIAKPDLFA